MAMNFDHDALTASDLARSVGCHRDSVGCEVMGPLRLPARKLVFLRAGDAKLERFHVTDHGRDLGPETRAIDLGDKQIGSKVADIDATAARLKAANVVLTVEPNDATAGGGRLAPVMDPDGTLRELIAGTLDLQTFQE